MPWTVTRAGARERALQHPIVVAHRLSTVVAADLILVLENGELVEQGSHGELIAKAVARSRAARRSAEIRCDAAARASVAC
jgi:ATP-binding cassette subfamily B protein